MPLPVIANTYRVTWNFLPSRGVTPRIVQHFLCPGDNVDYVGAAIVGACVDNMFNPMPQSFEPPTIDILPLDGVTPTRQFDLDPLQNLCQGAEEMSPASAAIISLRTDQRGPQGRGRSYVGPVAEASMENGQLEVADRVAMEDAWADFLSALAALDPEVLLVVASYAHEEAYPVQTLNHEIVLGTQRRRQSQLR